MQLKCKINNKEFNCFLVQGIPFCEEYTEILDSCTIILDQVEEIESINPYDDIYIYDGTFEGFDENGNVFGNYKFYKHFLIDQFTKEHLDFSKKNFKYTIQAFSELKGLETIQLPNISITQPLKSENKISILTYLNQFINMYSPKIKVAINENEWEYRNKYKLSQNLADVLFDDKLSMSEIFGKCYTPDFTLNNPNLKDVLSRLMITKDRIPYVYNNIIYALDITKRRGVFNDKIGEIGFITCSQSSQNYCDNLKRTYTNALGQPNTCKSIEYIGFRNKDSTLMKIEDLRLETSFPIYKINKIYMCYYKQGEITKLDGTPVNKYKTFICKQDITPLVKLNSERNLLSQDWDDFHLSNKPTDINELAKYKLSTVGYDIGSNYITGWGSKYTYAKGWWDATATYIENIFKFVDFKTPYGIYDYDYVSTTISGKDNLFYAKNGNLECVVSPFSNNSLKLKSFFFIIEYDGFYNGSIVHTKDGAESDITINDNPSSSLTLLEEDGLAQKEKINRFGNENIIITARYKNIDELQPLGSVFQDDIIIYHREYTVFSNLVLCTYYGMKDYVLKNYFTSVYAKHRPYNLMSYEESVTRAENKKNIFLLSKNSEYFEYKDEKINFSDFSDNHISKIFSCFTESKRPITIDNFIKEDNINNGYISIFSPTLNEISKFSTDINTFVSGNSLCFNLKMYDNSSMGIYIKKTEPFNNENYEKYDGENNKIDYLDWIINPEDTYSGSLQSWYMTVDNIETGFAKNIGFYVQHLDQKKNVLDIVIETDNEKKLKENVAKIYNEKLFKLPLSIDNDVKNIIGNTFEINKDNKEIIDMTYQLEPITKEEDILFSPWLMKLSELTGNYNKFSENFEVSNSLYNTSAFLSAESSFTRYKHTSHAVISLMLEKDSQNLIKEGIKVHSVFEFGKSKNYDSFYGGVTGYSFKCKQIDKIEKDKDGNIEKIIIYGTQIVKLREPLWGKEKKYEKDTTITFKNMDPLPTYFDDIWDIPKNKIYLCNGTFSAWTTGGGTTYLYFDYNESILFDDDKKDINDYYGTSNNKYIFKDGFIGYSKDIFNDTNSNIKPFKIENNYNITKEYKQNMFVICSKEKLKKTLVYDEYSENDFYFNSNKLNNISISEIFSINENKIIIDLEKISQETKSLQYWYLDQETGSYKFVFGVNLTEEDFKKGEVKIYISTLSSMNKKVYDNQYNLIGETLNYYTPNTITKDSGSFEPISTVDVAAQTITTIIPNEAIERITSNEYYICDKLTCNYTAKIEQEEQSGPNIENPEPTYVNYLVEYELKFNDDKTQFILTTQQEENIPVSRFSFIQTEDGWVSNSEVSASFKDTDLVLLNKTRTVTSMDWTEAKFTASNYPIYGVKQYYTKYD